MNQLQKVIIESLIANSIDMKHFVIDVKNTFTINTLCDILKINRNRYNYLKEQGQLDSFIFKTLMKDLRGENNE